MATKRQPLGNIRVRPSIADALIAMAARGAITRYILRPEHWTFMGAPAFTVIVSFPLASVNFLPLNTGSSGDRVIVPVAMCVAVPLDWKPGDPIADYGDVVRARALELVPVVVAAPGHVSQAANM
ncbi:MAG: hypothetical protein FJX78_06135 [Armatimonadetes bacterium]|nr:hypothetical protein [Armatimonadota bacterium]